MNSLLTALALCSAAALVSGCSDDAPPPDPEVDLETRCAELDAEVGVPRPAGWGVRSHCKLAPADIDHVFPTDAVPTLAIKMTAAEYAAMQADLEDLSAGGDDDDDDDDGGGGGDPFAACEGLADHADCEIDVGNGLEHGICVDFGGQLGCFPDSWRSPEEWVAACVGKSEGDPCSTETHEGTCWFDGVDLVCFPDNPGPDPGEDPCADKVDGDACTVGSAEGLCRRTTGPLICQADAYDPGNVDDVPEEAAAPFWSREPAYFHADIEFAGTLYTSVGIRYKGNNGLASSEGEKKPLRLKLDKWEAENPAITDQRLFGFQDLSFSPNQTDASNLHQVLAAELFRDHGVPAPQAGFVEVTLDTGDGPRLLGLYAMTEFPDEPMLDRYWGNEEGNLYKPDGRGAHLLAFVQASFHKQSNEMSDYTDIQGFLQALHASRADRPAWRTALAQRFDIEGFAVAYAVNQAIANWDTYGGLAHNFYFYADKESGQLGFIPWDFDLSFDGSGYSDLTLRSFDGTWPLLQAVARDVELATLYEATLADFATTELASGKAAQRVDTWSTLIRPAVEREDAVRGGVLSAFEEGVELVRDHLVSQRTAIESHVARKPFAAKRSAIPATARLAWKLQQGPHRNAKQRWRLAVQSGR
jgi:CotH protein